jgi:hypothetical protein
VGLVPLRLGVVAFDLEQQMTQADIALDPMAENAARYEWIRERLEKVVAAHPGEGFLVLRFESPEQMDAYIDQRLEST